MQATALIAASFLALFLSAAAAGEKAPVYPEHQDLLYALDASGAKHPVDSVDDWEVRRSHILAHMQTVMGPLPTHGDPVPLEMQTVEEVTLAPDDPVEGRRNARPAAGPLARRKLTYHTDSPDRVVSAYLFLPHAPGKKLPAVLCLHQTVAIGKEEPAGLGDRENLQYALHLARRGYVTLAPDYPSFGEYEYDFSDPRYRSGTMKAIYDNLRAVDLLQSLEEVDPERIGCIGHSLGGHNTIFTAAFEPRIKAAVSSCGFTRFHKYYEGRLGGWTSDRYMPLIASRYGNDPDRVPFDFTEIVASLAPRAFFASAPVRDGNFEVSGVRDVIAAARPIYALYGKADNLQANYPECAHDFPPDARRVAYAFLDRHLKPRE